jgi:hypothetical protein
MSEENMNENPVDNEVVQAVDAPVPETAEQETPVVATPPVSPKTETAAERNFRNLVDKTKRLERERDEALRLAQQAKQAVPDPEADLVVGQDELIEGKHFNKLSKEFKQLKEELKSYRQSSTALSEEAMLKVQYPDIDSVVSEENMELLRAADPDFVEMLKSSTNFKAKAVSAYKHIKKLGIYSDESVQGEKEIAQRNANKPKPLASISPQQGDSPLSRANAFANGLTPELKKQLIKEMEESRRSN